MTRNLRHAQHKAIKIYQNTRAEAPGFSQICHLTLCFATLCFKPFPVSSRTLAAYFLGTTRLVTIDVNGQNRQSGQDSQRQDILLRQMTLSSIKMCRNYVKHINTLTILNKISRKKVQFAPNQQQTIFINNPLSLAIAISV